MTKGSLGVHDVIDLRLGDYRKTLQTIGPGSVDLILTDPPYGNFFKHTRQKFNKFVVNGDDVSFLDDLFVSASKWLTKKGCMLSFCDHTGFSRFEAAANAAGLVINNIAVWDKKNFAIGYNFRPRHELILLFARPKTSIMARTRNLSLVLQFPRVSQKVHPTQKPVPLLKLLVENFSDEGQLVIDPFMGSGSTGVACKEANRRFIGSELEPAFFELCKARLP